MLNYRKPFILIITAIFILSLVSCSGSKENRPTLDINAPETIYEDLDGTFGEWTLDPSGQFSYLRLPSGGGSRPYFNKDMVFPGNYFIYETNTPSTDDEKLYGYMNTDFEKLSNPISKQPNIFMHGLARIKTDEGSYIINKDFETLEEYYPGYVLYDNSLVVVDWESVSNKDLHIVPNINPEEYLVPYKVIPGPETTIDIPVVGYKTIKNAYFSDGAPEADFEIPPVFEEAGLFINGVAAVKMNGKWGFIDQAGDFIIECEYYYARNLTHGIVAILSEIWPEMGKVQATRLWALFDTEGNQLTEFLYYGVSDFIDGIALMYFSLSASPKTAFVDTLGKQITPVLYNAMGESYYSEGFVLLSNSGLYFYDTNGNQAFGRRFSDAGSFSEGLAAFRESGSMLYGYIDTKGNVAIKKKYKIAGDFSRGYAYVYMGKDKGGYLIDKMENEYLNGLNLLGITKFNEEGYALGYSIELNEYTIPNPDNDSEMITEERQDTIYYMIHIESLD
jgi:hypothetical protein